MTLGPRGKEYLGIDDRDIVTRMRERQAAEHPLSYARDARDAADEIERLRAALKPFAELGAKLDAAPNLIGILTEEDWRRAAKVFNGEQKTSESPRRRTHFETDGCDPPDWHGPTGE